MSVTTINPPANQTVPTPPVKQDGSAYRYEMIHGTTRTWADTATELLAAIVPEHADLDDEDARARARLTLAIGVQVRLQAMLAVSGDLTSCRAEDREVLLGTRTQQPAVESWDAPVPLVLVASYYQPYTSLPGPVQVDPGEVIWLDPSSDEALIASLARAGVIGLAEQEHGERDSFDGEPARE